MSRIGNRKLTIPEGVNVSVEGNKITTTGSKGSLSLEFNKVLTVKVVDNAVVVEKNVDSKEANILSGTTNSNIENMLIGVSKGYTKELETVGVGYRFAVSGNKITVSAGYSNPVEVIVPEGLSVKTPSNTELTIEGIDKQRVSEFAANIRKIRKPEPYKGKGIRYKEEHIRRKEGKKASK